MVTIFVMICDAVDADVTFVAALVDVADCDDDDDVVVVVVFHPLAYHLMGCPCIVALTLV